MMRYLVLILFLFLFLLTSSPVFADDTHLWLSVGAPTFNTESFSGSLRVEERFRDNGSDVFWQQVEHFFNYKVDPAITIGAGMSYIRERRGNSGWGDEYRPAVFASHSLPVGSFTLSNRLLWEWRDRKDDGQGVINRWRYRLLGEYPLSQLVETDSSAKLFASQEFFYRSPDSEWSQFRSLIGVDAPLWKILRGSLSYGLQRVKPQTGEYDNRQIIVASVTFNW